MRLELGKISRADYGINDRGWLGLTLTFSGKSWGVGTFIPHNKTEELVQRLKDAGKINMPELVGVPVEVTFEGNLLKDWRVLTEVL